MRIIFDVDNTLIDSKRIIVDIYNKKYNQNVNHELCNTWEFKELPLTNPKEITGWFNSEDFFSGIHEITGMKQLVYSLYNEGHEIVMCSYCGSEQGIQLKRRYLECNYPFAELVLLQLGQDDSKLDKSAVVGDIIIDDNLNAISSSSCANKMVFGDYGWNNTTEYIKVKNARELREELNKILN